MNIKSNIKMEYKDSQYAEIVYKSLEVDNEGFVEGVLDWNKNAKMKIHQKIKKISIKR